MKPQIKNLALQGGGIWGLIHAGVWAALEELGLADGITTVAGTSAGSIVGFLIAMRRSAAQIKAIIDRTDFSKFKDGNLLEEIEGIKRFGIHPGAVFLQFIKDQIKDVTGNPDSTFLDFYKAGYRDLIIYATDLNIRSVVKFSALTTPHTPVFVGVRGSMSVPGFFEAYQGEDGHILVDGGLGKNYPITFMDTECPNPHTLGSCFGIQSSSPDNGLKYGDLALYVESAVETLLNTQYMDLQENPDNLARSIVNPTCGISAMDFDVDQVRKDLMFQTGRVTTLEKLAA